MRGALIVLEGIDRTGKTTQAARLCEALLSRNVTVAARRFPDRTTTIGKEISAYLESHGKGDHEDHVIHLLFAANRWEAREEMQRQLASGVTLVVDRYTYSGVAFSAAKGLDPDWCAAPDNGLLEPDVVFYLDMDVSETKERGNFGAERYEREEFQRQVRTMYSMLKQPNWIVINAAQSVESVHLEILSAALTVIKSL